MRKLILILFLIISFVCAVAVPALTANAVSAYNGMVLSQPYNLGDLRVPDGSTYVFDRRNNVDLSIVPSFSFKTDRVLDTLPPYGSVYMVSVTHWATSNNDSYIDYYFSLAHVHSSPFSNGTGISGGQGRLGWRNSSASFALGTHETYFGVPSGGSNQNIPHVAVSFGNVEHRILIPKSNFNTFSFISKYGGVSTPSSGNFAYFGLPVIPKSLPSISELDVLIKPMFNHSEAILSILSQITHDGIYFFTDNGEYLDYIIPEVSWAWLGSNPQSMQLEPWQIVYNRFFTDANIPTVSSYFPILPQTTVHLGSNRLNITSVSVDLATNDFVTYNFNRSIFIDSNPVNAYRLSASGGLYLISNAFLTDKRITNHYTLTLGDLGGLFSALGGVFSGIADILAIEIWGLPLALLLVIPLIVPILVVTIKLIRG
ncbi:MAG: hypothetical protein FWD49_07065 [Firmicutes bacterium]|nr:hypothetical protein [Bacillota bacterium]